MKSIQINKEILALFCVILFTISVIGFGLAVFYEHYPKSSHYNHNDNDITFSNDSSPSSLSFLGTLVHNNINNTNNSNNKNDNYKKIKKMKRKKRLKSSLLLKSRAFFVMGDSSVDCGEDSMFYPALTSNISFYPCSQGFESTLIHHFLAKKLKLPAIPAFHVQNGTIETILNGLNYGSAQSTILTRENGPNFQSLHQQLRQAFDTINLLQSKLGQVKAYNFISNSIFYLSIGKDDFINFLFENTSYSSDYITNTEQFSRLLIDEMTNVLRDLYDGGVRKVVVMGIYPLGCAPRVVVNWYFLRGRKRRIRVCVSEINKLISQHNQLLNDHIIELNMKLTHAQFIFCDVFEGFRQILSSPKKFGFNKTREACCGKGWHRAAEGCQSMENACNKTSAHVWWDLYNPTPAVNSLLADATWSSQYLGDICHPMSIQQLVKI